MSNDKRRFANPKSRAAVMAAALAMTTSGSALAQGRGDSGAGAAQADDPLTRRVDGEFGASEGEATEDEARQDCTQPCTVPLYGVSPIDGFPPIRGGGDDDDDDDAVAPDSDTTEERDEGGVRGS